MAETESPNDHATGRQSARRTATLLCVDDEPQILNALRRLFRSDGHELLLAPGGEEALELLEKNRVDLILSDMRMPGMSGAELLSEVSRRWPAVPRILLTGYSDLQSTITAVNQGRIYGYVAKPWEDEDLRLQVRNALAEKRLREDKNRLLALTRRRNAELRELNRTLDEKVEARTAELRELADMYELAYRDAQDAYLQAIPVFAHLMSLQDSTNPEQAGKVADLARGLANRTPELDEDRALAVYHAGLLHGIGMIGLPDRVAGQPYFALGKADRAIYRQHPVRAEGVLLALPPLAEAARYIRHHQEHWDGGGYPDGLAGESIPLGARLIGICRDYVDLSAGRLIEGVFDEAESRDYLRRQSGRRHDPAIVDTFLELLDELPTGNRGSQEVRLPLQAIRPGMTLTRDLITNEGLLLLTTGRELTEALIDRLRMLEKDLDRPLIAYVTGGEARS